MRAANLDAIAKAAGAGALLERTPWQSAVLQGQRRFEARTVAGAAARSIERFITYPHSSLDPNAARFVQLKWARGLRAY